eukprot:COSAG06_NODE_32826_length_499_cov_1.525000_1_plen_83_part_01
MATIGRRAALISTWAGWGWAVEYSAVEYVSIHLDCTAALCNDRRQLCPILEKHEDDAGDIIRFLPDAQCLLEHRDRRSLSHRT